VTPSLAQMKAELGAVVAQSPPGLSTANQLCQACVDLLDVDGAAISMVFDGVSQGTYGSSSETSRRLDEYQFTYGEGPCLDAASSDVVVHAPHLDGGQEGRWPVFTESVLNDGIRAVFALPVKITSSCVGALDLFRARPGPLEGDQLAAGLVAAELAAVPLLSLLTQMSDDEIGEHGTGADIGEDVFDVPPEMDRIEVYQASGMLIAQLGVGPSEALLRLRAHAITTGQTATEVARAVLDQGLQLERDVDYGRKRSRS